MEPVASLLVAAVLATAELCAQPFEGGVGEPQFCRLETTQEIATPYFSIVVEPEFLVGVHQQGRRLLLQPSYRQSQVHLIVEVFDGATVPSWPDCTEIRETSEGAVTWRDCRISTNGAHERRLAGQLKGSHVLISYSYSTNGTTYAPALERMTQSIRIHAI